MAETDTIEELITSFNELNSSVIEELDNEPSPLEFMRFVAKNTPFVIRGGAKEWTATKKWNAAYLRQTLKGHTVNVAVTPYGNADAPTLDTEGRIVFAKPHEEDQAFEELIDYLTGQERDPSSKPLEVRYAQTREYPFFYPPTSGPKSYVSGQKMTTYAMTLEQDPDAINMWIGNSFSTTAMHRDNYENIYVQIAGQKHFVLLPALCQPCINEQELRPASYAREGGNLVLKMDDGDGVPFAVWDPDRPHANKTKYSLLAQPMRVTLNPGDMLYLPAMWYHKVSQSCSDDGICVAVNYWYDMDFSGPLYPLTSFVRDMSRQI
ncbi:putative Phospholipase [Seiridium cardinale]|uniref:Phospholipase n=1 Tax=Seiridium cardinale TaxID=138064 RepID=A0ABR2XK62_9PEZI